MTDAPSDAASKLVFTVTGVEYNEKSTAKVLLTLVEDDHTRNLWHDKPVHGYLRLVVSNAQARNYPYGAAYTVTINTED